MLTPFHRSYLTPQQTKEVNNEISRLQDFTKLLKISSEIENNDSDFKTNEKLKKVYRNSFPIMLNSYLSIAGSTDDGQYHDKYLGSFHRWTGQGVEKVGNGSGENHKEAYEILIVFDFDSKMSTRYLVFC